MVKLTGVLNRLGSKKILVAGDLLLDSYTIGKARRISPEAPVAVIQVQKEEYRPGGSGNVILNLISMGAQVVALGRIGQDSHGKVLKDCFAREGVDLQGIMEENNYFTPVKNRIIADNQQIVRIDREEFTPLSEMLEQKIYELLPVLMQDVHVVAISDYGKGFLSQSLLSALIDHAKTLGIPVISDPKGIDFSKYSGSTILKPNLSEAYSAANLPLNAPLDHVAEKILKLSQSDVLMVTRSEHGISLFHKGGHRQDFPVRIHEVKDVTGAGDTVLAMLACALANGLTLAEAAQLSNIAAGIAIERFGCARVSLGDLARRLLQFDVANKIFDANHVFALGKALEGRDCAFLSLSCTQGLTSGVFKAIKELSGSPNRDLLISVTDENPDLEFVNILANIQDVDFIFIGNHGLQELRNKATPHEYAKRHATDGLNIVV